MDLVKKIKKKSFVCHLNSEFYIGDVLKVEGKRCITLSALKKICTKFRSDLMVEIEFAIEEIEKQGKEHV